MMKWKTDVMDTSLHSLLIETTIPAGVRFNENGVAMNGLRYEFNFRSLKIKFDVCALNGIWGGDVDIMAKTWGCGGSIGRNQDFKFRSFEECADSLWKYTYYRLERNKDNMSMEFLHFKVAYKKWLTLTTEQKYELFKETEFYGTL